MKKLGSVTVRLKPVENATTQQIRPFTYEKQPIYVCANDATRAIAVASSKGAIFPRKTGFCCIVASFLEEKWIEPDGIDDSHARLRSSPAQRSSRRRSNQ